MQQQQNFISSRDIRVISTSGHAIAFKAGKPTPVPKIMHQEVIDRGILPCDAGGERLDAVVASGLVQERPNVLVAPTELAERQDAIVKAMATIVKRNDAKDFSAGCPSAAAVTRFTGWRVDSKEVRALWVKHRPAILEANE